MEQQLHMHRLDTATHLRSQDLQKKKKIYIYIYIYIELLNRTSISMKSQEN